MRTAGSKGGRVGLSIFVFLFHARHGNVIPMINYWDAGSASVALSSSLSRLYCCATSCSWECTSVSRYLLINGCRYSTRITFFLIFTETLSRSRWTHQRFWKTNFCCCSWEIICDAIFKLTTFKNDFVVCRAIFILVLNLGFFLFFSITYRATM